MSPMPGASGAALGAAAYQGRPSVRTTPAAAAMESRTWVRKPSVRMIGTFVGSSAPGLQTRARAFDERPALALL